MYRSNRERTRDLLLEYDASLIPVKGCYTIAPLIYPQTSLYFNLLSDTLYALAAKTGYTGTKENFYKNFGSYFDKSNQEIIFDVFDNFPILGATNKLYFDIETQILYYWNGTEYLPVNAMLIAHTIINGGEA